MGVGVEDGLRLARKERNGHQGFDQLVGDPGAADWRAGECLGHFHANLRAHRRDVAGAQRFNQAGDANADAGAIHLHGFQQCGLLAPEIQLVFQQQQHLGQHVFHVVDGESVAALRGGEEFAQILEQRHILAEALRNIWLEDFEYALFAFPPGVIPGEADDCADAGFGKDGGLQFDGVFGQTLAQSLFDQAADFFCRHVRHPVFQLGERAPQFGRQAAVAREHLSDLLQPGHLVDQAEQAFLGSGIRGKFELLDHFGGEPPVREALEEELEGIADEGTPSLGGIGDQDLHRHQAADPLPDFGPPVRAAAALEGRFHGGDAAGRISAGKHARPQCERSRIDSRQER